MVAGGVECGDQQLLCKSSHICLLLAGTGIPCQILLISQHYCQEVNNNICLIKDKVANRKSVLGDFKDLNTKNFLLRVDATSVIKTLFFKITI